MAQRGQVFPLESTGGAAASWAYRYRTGGRGSHRVQRGGFPTRLAAGEAPLAAEQGHRSVRAASHQRARAG